MDINRPQSNLEPQPPSSEEDILAAAIEQLESGTPLAEVLAAYPADGAWLAPLLDMVADTKQLQAMVPTPDPADHLNIFLGQAQQLGGGAGSSWLRRIGRENPIYLLIAAFALIVLLLLLCTAGRQIPGLSGLIALPPATDSVMPTSIETPPATETATPTSTATVTLTATQSGQVIAPLTGTVTITVSGLVTPAQTESEAVTQTPVLTQTQSAQSGALATTPTSATDSGLVESGGQVTSTARITATASVQIGVQATSTAQTPATTQATPGAEETSSAGDAAGAQPALSPTPAPTQPGDPSDRPPEFLPVSGGIGPDSWLVLGLGLIGLAAGLILHRIAMRRE